MCRTTLSCSAIPLESSRKERPMDKLIPIVRPHFPELQGQLLSRLERALEEGCVTNNGPYVQDFEAFLSKYLRVPTICFSSGFTALQALLMGVGTFGNEVIYPAFTFP